MFHILSLRPRTQKNKKKIESSHTRWTKSSDAARLLVRTVVPNDPNQAKGEQILCKEDEIGVWFCPNNRRQNWQSHVFPNLHDAWSSSSSSPSYLMLLLSKVFSLSLSLSLSHLQQKCKVAATHSTIPSTYV